MYSHPPPGLGVVPPPSATNQAPPTHHQSTSSILGAPPSSTPLIPPMYHPPASLHQVPATGVPPPAMYTYPQQLGRPAPTTLMSHPPPPSGVVANPLPAAAMVQQQANTHHTLAHPLPQPTLPPTTSYIPTGANHANPPPQTTHTIQFNVPPPSLPTTFPPGSMQWPATAAATAHASFQSNFPTAFAPAATAPGSSVPGNAYYHAQPSYSAPPSRAPSPPSRDRSPIRKDHRYDDDYYAKDSRESYSNKQEDNDSYRERSDYYSSNHDKHYETYRANDDKYRESKERPMSRPKSRSKTTHRDRDIRKSTDNRPSKEKKERGKNWEGKRALDMQKQKEELGRREEELNRRAKEGGGEREASSRRRDVADSRDKDIRKPSVSRRSMEKPSRRSIDQSSSDRPAAERHSIERPSSDRRPTVERSSTDRRRRSPSPAVAETLLPSQAKIKQEEEEEQNALDLSRLSHAEIIQREREIWIRSCPATLYYQRDPGSDVMRATPKSIKLQESFEEKLIKTGVDTRAVNPAIPPPQLKFHSHANCASSDSSSSSDDEAGEEAGGTAKAAYIQWMETRAKDPNRLHAEIWQNMPGEMNDGPACRCPKKVRNSGIRHNFWVGEGEQEALDPDTNNKSKLYHYRVTMSPPTNFLSPVPTIIHHDEHEFIFEGFSMFTRARIPEDLPVCQIIRFNIEYSILFFEEEVPENFTIRQLELFQTYFFHELLELWDWDTDQRYFFMPRFVRNLKDNGKEILAMSEVLTYLLKSYKPVVDEEDLEFIQEMKISAWQNYTEKIKGMLVHYPGKRPSALRVDQLDRESEVKSEPGVPRYPDIVHFGLKPPQLCYAGNPEYQRLYREFVKARHLMANLPKPTAKDKQDLEIKEMVLQDIRSNIKLKRDTTVVVSSKGFHRTGLMTDIVQHALLLPVLVNHVRFHFSLGHLENQINYKFKNRSLLQQALTHPSYKENFGTNPDHMRNTLSNCGIRQPEYGDKKVHVQNQRKRGINVLINIMSRFGRKDETESKVKHNERLEFLGDAVVEFITSVHLFYMFPDLEEGGLATYRSAIVLNQHLAVLAGALGLEKYILFCHGSDLCHDSELRHAMANCFEAFLGAVFLDGGINIADKVFGSAMFGADPDLHETWVDLPHHPLQNQEPNGDRHWIETFPMLQKLVEFEKSTGLEFKHIRLLARAFTDRSLGFNNLTLGSNQRLEFLGDTVLQLVTSEFLYKHFPEHHEGHLSLLRASLVNNRTQSVVCDDLGMTNYAAYANVKNEFKVKDKADLLEALVGALYVDQDLYHCQVFAEVCFFPRLKQFIVNQDWNDPKSKLQQCCLTLRTMDGGEPDIPMYKVIECKGPSNTRIYTVAVYFRGERLAKSTGHSIQMAEFNAAKKAIEDCGHLFPHLTYQKRVLERSFKSQGLDFVRYNWQKETDKKRKELGMDDPKPPGETKKIAVGGQADKDVDIRRKKKPVGDTGSAKKSRQTRKLESKKKAQKVSKAKSTDDRPQVASRRDSDRKLSLDQQRSDHQAREGGGSHRSQPPQDRHSEKHNNSRHDGHGGDRSDSGHQDSRPGPVVSDSKTSRDCRGTSGSSRRRSRENNAGDERDRDIRDRRDHRASTESRRDEAGGRAARGRRSRTRSRGCGVGETSVRVKSEAKSPRGSTDARNTTTGRQSRSKDRSSRRRDRSHGADNDRTNQKSDSSRHRDSRKESRKRDLSKSREESKARRVARRDSETTSRRRESVSVSPRKSKNSRPRQTSKSPRGVSNSDRSLAAARPKEKNPEIREKDEKLNRIQQEIKKIESKLAKKKSDRNEPPNSEETRQDTSEKGLVSRETADAVRQDNGRLESHSSPEEPLLVEKPPLPATEKQVESNNQTPQPLDNDRELEPEKEKESVAKDLLVEEGQAIEDSNAGRDEVEAAAEEAAEAEVEAEEVKAEETPAASEIKSDDLKEDSHVDPKNDKEEGEIEEGECETSDEEEEEEEKEPVATPSKEPTPPQPQSSTSPTKSLLKRGKIEIKWKRNEDMAAKAEESTKVEKEKTAKEIEREEKKKRWRRESPKKRAEKEAQRLLKEESKHRSRKSRRSLSPHEREIGKRGRADYDRYDRYDYPGRSPPMYWPPEYYDRAFRSPPPPRSHRSPPRSSRSPGRDRYRSDRYYERDHSPDDIVNVSYFVDS